MRIMKFGGASIANAAMFKETASIIAQTEDKRVVVLSAMEGITDLLQEMLADYTNSKATLEILQKRHIETVRELLSDHHQAEALTAISPILDKLNKIMTGISFTNEMTPRLHDMVISTGERLSVHILAHLLNQMGFNSQAVEGDQISLLTDGAFGQATPLFAEIEAPLQQEIGKILESGTIPIITGFFGRDKKGQTTTFGRGGSDYVAGILAFALNATRCEVWKTVEGFMSTDPHTVRAARPLQRLSYEEASELAFFGAKVLHPRSVVPVQRKQIPIYVRNTTKPAADGTIISNQPASHGKFHSVVCKKNLAMITITGPDIAYTPTLADILKALFDHHINIYVVSNAISSLAILVDGQIAEKALKAIQSIPQHNNYQTRAQHNIALISVVGSDLSATPGIAADLFTLMAKHSINIEMISEGASDVALNFAVRNDIANSATEVIHRTFLEN